MIQSNQVKFIPGLQGNICIIKKMKNFKNDLKNEGKVFDSIHHSLMIKAPNKIAKVKFLILIKCS